MNNTEVRQQINQYLDGLSSERLELVADFLAYLADKESEDATEELVNIPGFIESFQRGKKDVSEGRVKSWRTIRSELHHSPLIACGEGVGGGVLVPHSTENRYSKAVKSSITPKERSLPP